MKKRTRVVCPDCGAGGASDRPCWCYICEDRVLMLPACNDHIESNWLEFLKYNNRDTSDSVLWLPQ